MDRAAMHARLEKIERDFELVASEVLRIRIEREVLEDRRVRNDGDLVLTEARLAEISEGLADMHDLFAADAERLEPS